MCKQESYVAYFNISTSAVTLFHLKILIASKSIT